MYIYIQDVTAADSALIASDGCRDKQEPVTHILAMIPEPRLIAIVRNKEKTETSKQTYDDIVKYGVRYCEECETWVNGYIGDNCNHQNKVKKMWRKEQNTGAVGCSTHGLSLVKGDVFRNDDNEDTMGESQQLQNKICNGKLGNYIIGYIIADRINQKVAQKYGAEYDQYDEVYVYYINYVIVTDGVHM